MLVVLRRAGAHIKYRASKRKKFFVLILAFLIFSFSLYIVFSGVGSALSTAIVSAAEAKISGSVNTIINNTINDYLKSEKIDYSRFYIVGENGAFGNTAEINSVKSEITEIIQGKINEIEILKVKIPLGSLTGSEYLMGIGPEIPFNFVAHGKVTSDFESNFSEAGINQTKHEVKIKIMVLVSMLLPSGVCECTVETSIPLADSITVGNVPQFYISKGE